MNRNNQKRGVLQAFLAAIVAAVLCSFTTLVGAQPAPTAPAQCGEYTRATTITLARGRNVSILTMLATAWEGLTDAEGTSYLNRGEMPRRVLLRSAWPTRDASITSSWAPPAANVPLLTMGQLVIDNPGHWTARYHKIFIVDLPEAVHINRSLSVSVTENVRELSAIPLQIGYRRDRIDVTTLGRLVAQPNATATTVEQLFTADASWFHLPASAVSQRTYSNWKVETLTGFSDRSRTFSIRRIGARRALQRSCEALPRVDSVIAGEDRAQLAELLVELDGVGSDPDAQSDLQQAVRAAHTRVVDALSQRLRPDRQAIASANRGRDDWHNAAVKNEASATAWRKVFERYRALIIRNVIIASVLLSILFAVLVAIIVLRKPIVVLRDSTPPPDGSRNTPDPGDLPPHHADPDLSNAGMTRGIDGIRNAMEFFQGLVTCAKLTAPAPNAPFSLWVTAAEGAHAKLVENAKKDGVTEGKAAMTFIDPDGAQILDQGRLNTLLDEAHKRGGDDAKATAKPAPADTTKATARAIKDEATARLEAAQAEGEAVRFGNLTRAFSELFQIMMGAPAPVTPEGFIDGPLGLSDRMEERYNGLVADRNRAVEALEWVKGNASKGTHALIKAARRGLGEDVKKTGANPAAPRDPAKPVTAAPGDGQVSSGVVKVASAPEAADDHPTEQTFATDELLAAMVDDVEAELVEPAEEPAPTVPSEDYRLATKIFNTGFRRLYGRVFKGEHDGDFAPGAAHAIGQAVAVMRNMLQDYGYEAEAIDLATNFRGCPEINWSTTMGMRDRSNGGTTQLVDVTPDGRTPQRLVIDRYCAIASFINRVVNGGTDVSHKPQVKAIFDDEIKILTGELRAADNNFAADALVDGLSNVTKSVRTAALPRAQAKAPAASVERSA